jgi:hypothetical protein
VEIYHGFERMRNNERDRGRTSGKAGGEPLWPAATRANVFSCMARNAQIANAAGGSRERLLMCFFLGMSDSEIVTEPCDNSNRALVLNPRAGSFPGAACCTTVRLSRIQNKQHSLTFDVIKRLPSGRSRSRIVKSFPRIPSVAGVPNVWLDLS